MKKLLPLILPLAITITAFTATSKHPEVAPPSSDLRQKFELSEHYQKALVIEGFPIVASKKVNDASLYEAAFVIRQMLKNRDDILRKLGENKIRLSIMATDERTTDVPEHSDLSPPEYWNRRSRGLGATRTRPSVSCGEENLIHNEGDPYATESIMVHEFAHAIHLMAVNDLDPTFDQRLEETYRQAMAHGLWENKYASQNSREYFAEGVQSWFDTNREPDHDHNHVNTRSELIAYDPGLSKIVEEVFGENDWRYVRSDDPSRANEPHLKLLERSKLPSFQWTKEEIEAYEKVSEGGKLKSE